MEPSLIERLRRHGCVGSLGAVLAVLAACDGTAHGDDPSGGGPRGALDASTDAGVDDAGADAGALAHAAKAFDARIFDSFAPFGDHPRRCNSASDCDGQSCIRMTEQFGICDAPVAEAVACTVDDPAADVPDGGPTPDECGCEGAVCASGELCRTNEATCSCGAEHWNTCVEQPCRSEADCAEGSLCYPSQYVWGPRCFVPECHSDAECDGAPFGICALQVYEPFQAGDTWLGPLRCYYPDEYLSIDSYTQ